MLFGKFFLQVFFAFPMSRIAFLFFLQDQADIPSLDNFFIRKPMPVSAHIKKTSVAFACPRYARSRPSAGIFVVKTGPQP
jgi:hypothetical protein